MKALTAKELLTIGNNIRNMRLKYSLTQQKMAELLDCSECHLSHVENGARPSLDMVVNIALALNCSIDELIGLPKKLPSPKQKFNFTTRHLSDRDKNIAVDLLEDILLKFDMIDKFAKPLRHSLNDSDNI